MSVATWLRAVGAFPVPSPGEVGPLVPTVRGQRRAELRGPGPGPRVVLLQRRVSPRRAWHHGEHDATQGLRAHPPGVCAGQALEEGSVLRRDARGPRSNLGCGDERGQEVAQERACAGVLPRVLPKKEARDAGGVHVLPRNLKRGEQGLELGTLLHEVRQARARPHS